MIDKGNVSATAGAKLFPYAGVSVGFSPETRSILMLNPSAAVIWESYHRGQPIEAAADQLVENFGISAQSALNDATAGYSALKRYESESLHRAEAPSAEDWFGHRFMEGALDTARAAQAPDLVFELFERRVGVRAPLEFRGPLLELLGAFAVSGEQERTSIELIQSGHLTSIQGAGPTFAAARTFEETIPSLAQSIFATALKRAEFALVIHAACARRGKHAFLMPGASGNGKSTLTAALGRRGFEIIADDTTVFTSACGLVRPSAYWLSIKQGSYDLLAHAYPELTQLKDYSSRERTLRLIPNVPGSADGCSITDILFPSYRGPSDGSVVFQPLSKEEALLRITDSGYWFPSGITPSEIQQFLGLIEQVPCNELLCCDLARSIEFMTALTDQNER